MTFRFLILATKTATRGLVFFKKRPRPGAFLTSWAAAELLTGRHVTSGFHSEVWPRPIGTGVAASTNPSPHLPPTHTADTRCPLISGHCNGGDRAPLPHRPSAPPNKGGGSSLSHLPPPTGQQQDTTEVWSYTGPTPSNIQEELHNGAASSRGPPIAPPRVVCRLNAAPTFPNYTVHGKKTVLKTVNVTSVYVCVCVMVSRGGGPIGTLQLYETPSATNNQSVSKTLMNSEVRPKVKKNIVFH